MEGEIEAPLGCHAIEPYIADIAAAQGLLDFTYTVKPDAKAGGYVGVVTRVTLSGRRDGAAVSLPLFFKDQPADAGRRQLFNTAAFFANEATFYNSVFPAIERLQDERGVRGSERFAAYPRSYHAGDVVVLEDVSPAGYKMADRVKTLDYAHCSLVMKEMGALHAFSFALRDQKPEEFAQLATSLVELIAPPLAEGPIEHWNNCAQRTCDKYSGSASKGRKYEKALRRYCDDIYPTMAEAVDGKRAEPYAVISHGDCWTNNYLFKYAEDDGSRPATVCLLDFQLARYSSPACDVAYFLSFNTDKVTRARHLRDLLRDYHDSLAGFLRKLGSDPDQLFPFAALEDQLRKFGSFGLGMAILALPLVADAADAGPDLDKIGANTLDQMGASDNPAVWRRMTDLVDDMVDLGYIRSGCCSCCSCCCACSCACVCDIL